MCTSTSAFRICTNVRRVSCGDPLRRSYLAQTLPKTVVLLRMRQGNFDFESAAEETHEAFVGAKSAQERLKVTSSPVSPATGAQVSELLADAPDSEGQVIGHWSEQAGSRRWALVEPDLAALSDELRNIRASCEKLERTVQKSTIMDELEDLLRDMTKTYTLESQEWLTDLAYDDWREKFGLSKTLFDFIDTNCDGKVSWQEFVEVYKLRNQLHALKAKEEALKSTIEQYKPDEHAPECIAEGGQGRILVGKVQQIILSFRPAAGFHASALSRSSMPTVTSPTLH